MRVKFGPKRARLGRTEIVAASRGCWRAIGGQPTRWLALGCREDAAES